MRVEKGPTCLIQATAEGQIVAPALAPAESPTPVAIPAAESALLPVQVLVANSVTVAAAASLLDVGDAATDCVIRAFLTRRPSLQCEIGKALGLLGSWVLGLLGSWAHCQ